MHSNLQLKTNRSPESLLPPGDKNQQKEQHPNAIRLEKLIISLPPSQRAAFLETAYVRTIKDLPDNSSKNYIPPSELARILEKWMNDGQDKYYKIAYLKSDATNVSGNDEQESPSNRIAQNRIQLKAIMAGQKGNFF